jgi:phosphate uptake regulator
MQRKLIKQGVGGYTIYLPKEWIDRKGLKEGDSVDIVEAENSLIIGSEAKKKKKFELEVGEEYEKDIEVILTHLYRRGFDKIVLNGISSAGLQKVKSVVKDLLLGFEVTEKSANSCTIENISEPTEQKYDSLMRRIFLIIQETQEVVAEDFRKSDFGNWEEIAEMRKSQDKFILFCRRILIKEKYERDSVVEWELLTFLMHIEHTYYYLYKYAKENKIKSDKDIIRLIESLKDYFGYYRDAYFSKNLKIANKVANLRFKYAFGECLDVIEKEKGKNAVIASYIREIYRLINIGISPVLSEILDKEYRSENSKEKK